MQSAAENEPDSRELRNFAAAYERSVYGPAGREGAIRFGCLVRLFPPPALRSRFSRAPFETAPQKSRRAPRSRVAPGPVASARAERGKLALRRGRGRPLSLGLSARSGVALREWSFHPK